MSLSMGSIEIPLQLKKKPKNMLGLNHNSCHLILSSHLEKKYMTY